MTTETAARPQTPLAGAGRHPCDPATLTARCIDCDDLMHVGGRRNTRSGRCCEGHYRHAARGKCRRCNQRDEYQTRRRTTQTDAPPPPPFVDNPHWRDRAACRDADWALFFPDLRAGQPARPTLEPTATRWCQPCPVRADCGAYADQTKSVGLWGAVYRRWRGNTYERVKVLNDERIAS